jgi:cytoskeletal protein CcmA (bactofilin family)
MFFRKGKIYLKAPLRRLEDQSGAKESFIAADTDIKGILSAKDSIRIAGVIEGEVASEGLVWIIKGGRVDGTITAYGVIAEGEINGNVNSTGTTELRSGARVTGDIVCAKLSVADDAFLKGKIKMPESQGQPHTFVAKRKGEDEFKKNKSPRKR